MANDELDADKLDGGADDGVIDNDEEADGKSVGVISEVSEELEDDAAEVELDFGVSSGAEDADVEFEVDKGEEWDVEIGQWEGDEESGDMMDEEIVEPNEDEGRPVLEVRELREIERPCHGRPRCCPPLQCGPAFYLVQDGGGVEGGGKALVVSGVEGVVGGPLGGVLAGVFVELLDVKVLGPVVLSIFSVMVEIAVVICVVFKATVCVIVERDTTVAFVLLLSVFVMVMEFKVESVVVVLEYKVLVVVLEEVTVVVVFWYIVCVAVGAIILVVVVFQLTREVDVFISAVDWVIESLGMLATSLDGFGYVGVEVKVFVLVIVLVLNDVDSGLQAFDKPLQCVNVVQKVSSSTGMEKVAPGRGGGELGVVEQSLKVDVVGTVVVMVVSSRVSLIASILMLFKILDRQLARLEWLYLPV
ncbi:hypothetical protein BKA80DRAFT_303431 [Phyllosticta citrichinensis]